MRAPDYTTPEMWETLLSAAHIYLAIIAGTGTSDRCWFIYAGILMGFVLLGTKQCWIAGTEILSRDRPFQSWWSTWGIYCKPTSVRYVMCIIWLLKPAAEPLLSWQSCSQVLFAGAVGEPSSIATLTDQQSGQLAEEWLLGEDCRGLLVIKSCLALPAGASCGTTAVVT